MKTSRQQVLDFIRLRQVVSATEISSSLRMTRANARHHLAILEEQGAIQVVEMRKAHGKGRPTHLYSLSPSLQGDNLPFLASALLDELNRLSDQEKRPGLLRLARAMVTSSEAVKPSPSMLDASALSQRLLRLVQRLNRQGYHARWEARAEAPRLILGHCPYSAIIASHPELCQLDAYLIEEMLQRRAEQKDKLTPDSQGVPYCAFRIS